MAPSASPSIRSIGVRVICDVTAAVVAGAAVAGAAASTMNKPKAPTQTTSQTQAPWGPQASQLEFGMGEARRLYEEGRDKPAFPGEASVGLNDTQRTALQGGTDFANGSGAALTQGATANAANLMGATSPMLQNAGALAAGGTGGPNAAAAGVLQQAATGPAQQLNATGRGGVAGVEAAMGQAGALSARAAQDPNAALRAAATGYVNSQDVDAQVDAASRDVTRQFSEETIPGLNARAMAGGTVNSARAGAAEAVARRGAEDRVADISSAIRTNAFNTGLQTATTAAGQQNALALGANEQAGSLSQGLLTTSEAQRQFDTNTRTGAAANLGELSLGASTLDARTRLEANGQLGEASRAGFDAAQAAGVIHDANMQRIGTQGTAEQMEAQRVRTEEINRYYSEEQRKQQLLGQYWDVVGARSYGSQTDGTTTGPTPASPSMLQGALGGAAAGAGVMSGNYGGAVRVGTENTAGGGILKSTTY